MQFFLIRFDGMGEPLTNKLLYCTVYLYRMERFMTIHTTYTQARDGLAKLLDQVTHNREVVLIQRRGEEEVAMIAASELVELDGDCLSAALTSKCRTPAYCPWESIEK
jgi:UDP-N-acetyl-D-mannosaminuronic acid transferase (WecB/TagA/CpsF family)